MAECKDQGRPDSEIGCVCKLSGVTQARNYK
jgi:hypothetical protein